MLLGVTPARPRSRQISIWVVVDEKPVDLGRPFAFGDHHVAMRWHARAGHADAGYALVECMRQVLGPRRDCDRGLEARRHMLARPPRLYARARGAVRTRRAVANAAVPVAAIGWRAKQPEAAVVVVWEGVQKAEPNAAAYIGHHIARRKVADSGVRVVRKLREPLARVVQVFAADVLQHIRLLVPPENGILDRVDVYRADAFVRPRSRRRDRVWCIGRVTQPLPLLVDTSGGRVSL